LSRSIFGIVQIIGQNASRQVLAYFIATILIGSIVLSLPFASQGRDISYVDALFTSTSAVCVTGLIVLDTPKDFSFGGQLVILALIQLGGLGMMTFASALVLSLGARLSIRHRHGLTETLGSGPAVPTGSLMKAVFITTMLVEAVGAVILYVPFSRTQPAHEAAWNAVFHSISAFCNAGFSTYSNSLEGYQGSPVVLLTVACLIIIGGLGFVVIHELVNKVREPQLRLSLHTKLCLITSIVLIVFGFVAFLSAEYGNTLADMSIPGKMLNAFFQSVTTRTAGFNSLQQNHLTEFSLLLTLIFMFIGGCPGSTAGGVKTTTFAILGILAWRRLLGFRSISAFRASISEDSTTRALAILVSGGMLVLVAAAAFVAAESPSLPHVAMPGQFVESLFEVVSALGTVGLSMGKTGTLDAAGKVIIIILMFAGRVGLLTLVLGLSHPVRVGEITYLDEDVMVG